MSALEFPITDDVTHAAALEWAHRLIESDLQKGTLEADLLDWLAERIEAYERVRWPFDEPTPEEAAAFRREQEEGA